MKISQAQRRYAEQRLNRLCAIYSRETISTMTPGHLMSQYRNHFGAWMNEQSAQLIIALASRRHRPYLIPFLSDKTKKRIAAGLKKVRMLRPHELGTIKIGGIPYSVQNVTISSGAPREFEGWGPPKPETLKKFKWLQKHLKLDANGTFDWIVTAEYNRNRY